MSALPALIEHHRHLYHADLLITRLVSRQPPVAFTYDESLRMVVPDDRELVITDPDTGAVTFVPDSATQSTQVGMPLSRRLMRYVAHQDHAGEFPWHAAFRRLRLNCRREHPHHSGRDVPYWRGSLCQEAVRLTVIGPERRTPRFSGPMSLHDAARLLRYDNLGPVLRYSLVYIESAMDAARERAERRVREDEGRGPGAVPANVYEQRHDQPGLHRHDCPKCRREDVA